jgi:hypothetical protein
MSMLVVGSLLRGEERTSFPAGVFLISSSSSSSSSS